MGANKGKGAANTNCLEVPKVKEKVGVVAWEEFKGEVAALVWFDKVCGPSAIDA